MAVNKVEVNGETVLDLTNDTVSEDSLLDGTTAHNGAGNPIEGKVKLSSVSIKDNENGGIDISVDENKKTLASQESVSKLKDDLSAAVSQHNTDTAAHNDLRLVLQELSDRINAALDSDDATLDQMSEVVAYIKSNKSLIDAITTSKVSVADIVNNLTINVSNKPLSAAQGVVLKGLIDTVSNRLANYQPKGNYLTTETDPTVPSWAKQSSKPSYSKSEVGLGNVDNVKQYSASNPPPYPVTSVNGKTGAVTITVPTVPTNVSAFANDAGYLTEHQDISGKLDADKLPEAVNYALEQAKTSGEFDGQDGHTPVKGVDYFTDADKAEMVSAVIAQLPVYAGEVV